MKIITDSVNESTKEEHSLISKNCATSSTFQEAGSKLISRPPRAKLEATCPAESIRRGMIGRIAVAVVGDIRGCDRIRLRPCCCYFDQSHIHRRLQVQKKAWSVWVRVLCEICETSVAICTYSEVGKGEVLDAAPSWFDYYYDDKTQGNADQRRWLTTLTTRALPRPRRSDWSA